jgi:hypothetical protein
LVYIQWGLALLVLLYGGLIYWSYCLPLAGLLANRGLKEIGIIWYVVCPPMAISIAAFVAFKIPVWLFAIYRWY